jgi:hypothetical protein
MQAVGCADRLALEPGPEPAAEAIIDEHLPAQSRAGEGPRDEVSPAPARRAAVRVGEADGDRDGSAKLESGTRRLVRLDRLEEEGGAVVQQPFQRAVVPADDALSLSDAMLAGLLQLPWVGAAGDELAEADYPTKHAADRRRSRSRRAQVDLA